MEWRNLSEDQLDELIIESEQTIARCRAVEMAVIREKQVRQSHHADGYRSIVDWMAARADISHRTSRSLCWTATRLSEAPEVADMVASGDMSFDRAEQLARLPQEHRSDHEGYDIAQLRRRVAHYRKLSPQREQKVSQNGYLNFQSSWDETSTRFWGELSGVDARMVEKAVDQRADEIIGTEPRLAVAERRVMALVAICQDALYTDAPGTNPRSVELTVTVDARTAAESNGQTGVAVLTGPRIGRQALDAIACNAIVEVVGISEEGTPLGLGRKTRTIPTRLRRYILTRDGGCTVEGCSSRYRLETHHVQPWSQGGTTDAENLITLCWFHHHVAVHREQLRIRRVGQSRVRLKRPIQG